jgi:predicted dehydrogenase
MKTGTRQNIQAGIIGLSWIAADPADPASAPYLGSAPPYSHASAMAALGNIDIAAICDVRPEARAGFIDSWSDRWESIQAYPDAESMLENPLDLVSVVTPDHLHGVMIERCLNAGVKMIFSEKPFTTSLEEADRLLDRIDETGATVAVNHTWRWRPDVVEAKALVDSGDLGPLSQISIEAGGPRAMLFRNLSHFLDLALHVAGRRPLWVSAELEPGTGAYGLEYSGGGGSDPDLDPGALAIIGFDDGIRAYVSGLKASPADVSVQIQCLQGRITIDPLGARVVENPRTSDGTPASVGGPLIRPLKPRFRVSGMEAGLADLITAAKLGAEPSGSARSARETVAVIDAILRSHASSERTEVTPRGTS